MNFSKGLYNVLKSIALLWLPAAGTLYFTLASIWQIPNPEKVIGTIVAIDTFLGVVLKIVKNPALGADGTVWVHKGAEDERDTYRFDLETPLEEYPGKNEVRLAIRQPVAKKT